MHHGNKLRLNVRRLVLPFSNPGNRSVLGAQRHARYDVTALCYFRTAPGFSLHFTKQLRSRETDVSSLFLRTRLLKFLDQPWQTRAKNILRKTLELRQGALSPSSMPIMLPPTAHSLRSEVKWTIRFLIRQERCNFPPFHLPNGFQTAAANLCTCIQLQRLSSELDES